jgi:hypothetical protein
VEFFGFRVKYWECHKFFRRDIMAGANIVNIYRPLICYGSIPEGEQKMSFLLGQWLY